MNLKHIFICLLLILFGASCSSDEEKTKEQIFEIRESELVQNFLQGQTSVTIPVTSSLEQSVWSVESDQKWCLVTKDGSSSAIKVVVLANEEPDVRKASVQVKSPVKNYTITVSQLGYGKAILLKKSDPSIEAEGGQLSVTVTANVAYTVQIPADCKWIQEKHGSKTRALVDYDHYFVADANTLYADRTAEITFADKESPEVKAACSVVQKALKSDISDVVVEGDILIKPTGGKANQAQPNQGIENSFDGKFGSEPYHSPWGDVTRMPVILEYFFDGSLDMDYLIYYTRSGNGNFGKVNIYLATVASPEYTLQGEYDFKMQNAPSKVEFAASAKVTKVKFEVLSGLGNFASCDEMQFLQKNKNKTLDKQLLAVFTDLTCSQIKTDATIESINKLPGYFASLAMQLKNGTYDAREKEFRIRDYKAYSNVEEWAVKLMTKKYSNLDNPTGIHANPGDSLVVLVGDTHGQRVSLQCIGEDKGEYLQTAASGDMYFLEEGVNKIGIRNTGMLFVMYNTDISSPAAKPIRIHIPPGSGTADGFFDLKEHKTDEKYAELLSKATYKYFCVRGEKIMFYFHRTKLNEFVPKNILSAIELWDNIIGWQQELMGITDVRPTQVNNHIFAISPEGSYMWASDYRIGFVYTYLDNILLYDKVMSAKDNAWGPAHEIGHIHQAAINWPSSTESSNNLFSNYTLYKLGKYCSRGNELARLATARFVDKQPWCTLGSSTHQNEDTETHMRMNWQLWNYYHRCGYKSDFFQQLFKALREDRIVESDPGAAQLKFARLASRVANENLTDFFEMWGFFEPVDNLTIEQYGTWKYNVTQSMINETKSYMAQFPAARHAFYYLEDRKNTDVGIDDQKGKIGDVGHWSQFKSNAKITKSLTYSQSGRTITVSNGDEAVAFEIRRGDKLLYFSNFYSFQVPTEVVLDGVSIYAVQADGVRKQVQKK